MEGTIQIMHINYSLRIFFFNKKRAKNYGSWRGKRFYEKFFIKIFVFYAHGNNPVKKKSLMNPLRGIIDGAWSLRRQEASDRSRSWL